MLGGCLCSLPIFSTPLQKQVVRKQILENEMMSQVEEMARQVVKSGFNAGDGYGEVWIRDFNTFIELAMEVNSDATIEEALNTFFMFQGPTGDIVDGYIPIHKADLQNTGGYKYRLSELEKNYAAHKNTVETDHETSLIQAVCKYIRKSGNYAYLQHKIGEYTVYQRMEKALEYLFTEKFDSTYGLITGATTVDWGDVQPEHIWGVEINEDTHYAIDIYDNAMVMIALSDFMKIKEDQPNSSWERRYKALKQNIRTHLWDEKQQKFIPHLYLGESPFPEDFDENQIYYHGGTAVAIQAGLLTNEEVEISNKKMLENVKKAHASTIGLTIYPTYPAQFFKNKSMYPYGYQNGGDWTWFGGRMIQGLIQHGFIKEAYSELQPMLRRVIENKGFNEWYTPAGEPMGSGTFKGEAGVLFQSIRELKEWALLDTLPMNTVDKATVFLTFGQSNSANHGATPFTPTQAVYNYYKGLIFPLSDPLIGATGEGGSAWSRMAEYWIQQEKSSSVLIVPIGFGGSAIHEWTPQGRWYSRLTTTLEQLKADKITPDYILWHQGETDNILGTDQETYISHFESIRDVIRSYGFNAPIYIALASYHPYMVAAHEGNSPVIRNAQKMLIKKYPDIYEGPDTDKFNQLYQRHDGVHFSEPGLELHAKAWLKKLK